MRTGLVRFRHGNFTLCTVRSSQLGSTPNAYKGAQADTGSKERSFLRVTQFYLRIWARASTVTLVLVLICLIRASGNRVHQGLRDRPCGVYLALITAKTSGHQGSAQIGW